RAGGPHPPERRKVTPRAAATPVGREGEAAHRHGAGRQRAPGEGGGKVGEAVASGSAERDGRAGAGDRHAAIGLLPVEAMVPRRRLEERERTRGSRTGP